MDEPSPLPSPESPATSAGSVLPTKGVRARGIPEDPSPIDSGDITLLSLVNILLRRAGTIVTTIAIIATIWLTWTVLQPPVYTADSVFMPQNPQAASRVSGLAAQLGINVASGGSSESVQFYADLLKSRELLRRAVLTEFEVRSGSETTKGNLVELYETEGDTEESRTRQTVALLRDQLDVSMDLTTGLVRLQTNAPWADLAAAVNRRMLELLNEFNLSRRQSQARAESEFLRGRLEEARQQLEAAESELQSFLDRNRRFQESPQLSFESGRLQRRVDLQQQVYTSLAQSYEQARIEEVRNTPVITVIDTPEGSTRRTDPGLLRALILALILGGFIGIMLAFTREFLVRQRVVNPVEHQEFVALRRHLFRRLSRPFAGRPAGRGLLPDQQRQGDAK